MGFGCLNADYHVEKEAIITNVIEMLKERERERERESFEYKFYLVIQFIVLTFSNLEKDQTKLI